MDDAARPRRPCRPGGTRGAGCPCSCRASWPRGTRRTCRPCLLRRRALRPSGPCGTSRPRWASGARCTCSASRASGPCRSRSSWTSRPRSPCCASGPSAALGSCGTRGSRWTFRTGAAHRSSRSGRPCGSCCSCRSSGACRACRASPCGTSCARGSCWPSATSAACCACAPSTCWSGGSSRASATCPSGPCWTSLSFGCRDLTAKLDLKIVNRDIVAIWTFRSPYEVLACGLAYRRPSALLGYERGFRPFDRA